jgi:hypothetical protein
MLRAVIYFLVTFVLSLSGAQENPPVDNISGPYQVRKNFHYANKTTISWGHNSETLWNVTVLLASTLATYDCSNTSSYVCLDPSWIYDWNKLWGKGRCGYFHDHHEDSDRFVWRRYLNKHILIQVLMFVCNFFSYAIYSRCSDSSCASYIEGTQRIQLAAYSYDGGDIPYQNQGRLLKEFVLTVEPNVKYMLSMAMDATGLTTFTVGDENGSPLESQFIQHNNTCVDTYFEGKVEGLYFGGTCRAPEDIVIQYF